MPASKNRPAHHTHQQHQPVPHHSKPKTNRAVMVSIIFFALLGLGISYFINPESTPALIGGAVTGAVAGYFFGHQIDKALSKK